MRPLFALLPSLLAALLLAGCCAPASFTLHNPSTHTTVRFNPSLGGRVTDFSPNGHSNLLWSCPNTANPDLYGWLNSGGEKTWIGPQPLWKEVSPPGWPPPLFFDTTPYTILHTTPTSTTLLSAFDPAWKTQIQRTLSLTNDTLYITSSLTEPNPNRLLWSVVQTPFSSRITARLAGPRRILNTPSETDGPLPPPTPIPNTDLLLFELPSPTPNGKCVLDADLLAVQYPDGTLVIQHHTPNPDFGSTPFRAHLYRGLHLNTTPEQGGAYLELEFLTPSSSPHTISLHFLPNTLCTDSKALEALP